MQRSQGSDVTAVSKAMYGSCFVVQMLNAMAMRAVEGSLASMRRSQEWLAQHLVSSTLIAFASRLYIPHIHPARTPSRSLMRIYKCL